ncbi:MAG: hypothetical protein IKV10_02935 [Alphaproteobacteria bacterium]|nr:hypothetical protein [Alphaproteobacteria bacterium]
MKPVILEKELLSGKRIHSMCLTGLENRKKECEKKLVDSISGMKRLIAANSKIVMRDAQNIVILEKLLQISKEPVSDRAKEQKIDQLIGNENIRDREILDMVKKVKKLYEIIANISGALSNAR